jgi:hypothetical protein
MTTIQPPVIAGDPTVVLSAPTGSLSLHLLPSYGLTFHRLLVNDYDVLIGPESSESYLSEGRNFRNQVIGRYANRLPGGRWQVDGIEVNLVGDGTCESDEVTIGTQVDRRLLSGKKRKARLSARRSNGI